MPGKSKKLRFLFIFFWFLLAYILAALIWWFIALNNQNRQMTQYKLDQLNQTSPKNPARETMIREDEKRKTAQFAGEGSIFFLLIITGAVFVYRAVSRQLKTSLQQQHFMMALTHELKTPIAIAKLNLETLQKRKLEGNQQQKILQSTLQETNRLNDLCNNMLLSSQIEAGGYQVTTEETNWSEIIAEGVHDFVIRYPLRVFHPVIKENLFIRGDRLLLQMVINNLIENAIKYSPKESPVTITLKEKDNKIILSIGDQGKGIVESEKEKIFSKFYRIGNEATKTAKGTGLGLYLTQKIVKEHNGNISVTDNSPVGSIFTVIFYSSF